MLLRNCGVIDIGTSLKVSRKWGLNQLIMQSKKCNILPQKEYYKSVQVYEYWSFIEHKKNKKRWLIYDYSPENDIEGLNN